MKKTEVIKLLKFLNSYYSKKFEYPKETKEDTEMTNDTWYMFLKEYKYNLVSTATKKLVVEKEWPPTPGELIQQIEKMQMNEEEKLTGAEAWSKLIEAVKKYGRYREKEMLESLPDRVAKAAKVTGMETIYMNNDSYMMNRYIQTYNQIQERDFERQMLPGNIRKDIDKIERPKVNQLAEKLTGSDQGA